MPGWHEAYVAVDILFASVSGENLQATKEQVDGFGSACFTQCHS